jgi:hypothetical protein
MNVAIHITQQPAAINKQLSDRRPLLGSELHSRRVRQIETSEVFAAVDATRQRNGLETYYVWQARTQILSFGGGGGGGADPEAICNLCLISKIVLQNHVVSTT